VSRLPQSLAIIVLIYGCVACNSDVPEPASVDLSSAQVRLTIARVATHPFLARYNLRLTIRGPGGCSSTADLFPDTGYVSRRNLYQMSAGAIYVIGQFDARVIDIARCTVTLAEFRHLERDAMFLGSFDTDATGRWTYLSTADRPERPFDKR
jgi:hypothetical protein